MEQQTSGSMEELEEVRHQLMDALCLSDDLTVLRKLLLALQSPSGAASVNGTGGPEAAPEKVATRSQTVKDGKNSPVAVKEGKGAKQVAASTKNSEASTVKKVKAGAKPKGASASASVQQPVSAVNTSKTERNAASKDHASVRTVPAKGKDGANASRKDSVPKAVSSNSQESSSPSDATHNAGASADDRDVDGYVTVTNRKGKSLARTNANTASTAPKRTEPLVLEGVSEEEGKNPFKLGRLLRGVSELISKTLRTKAGKILVFPCSDEARRELLEREMGQGLRLRAAKNVSSARRAANLKPTVVIVGVDPSLDDEEITDYIGRQCTRILSNVRNGERTWKVKMLCESEEDKTALLQSGVKLGGLAPYKCVEYKHSHPAMQCYNCQGFSHLAAACTNEARCRKCGEQHSSRECTSVGAVKCSNCGEGHAASDFSCPVYKSKNVEKETSTLSYADAVRKAGDLVECARMACMVAKTVKLVTDRLGLNVAQSDVAKDAASCVSEFYKVNVRGEYVHQMAFAKKRTASSL